MKVKIVFFGVNGEIKLATLLENHKSAYMGNLTDFSPCPEEILNSIPKGTLEFCKNNPPQYYYLNAELIGK